MSDVLISYSREDRATAAVLAAYLELHGFECWWDRDLLSGDDFEQEIGRQLATARAVVVIWSNASVKSGWVRDEASAAMERGVLVPVTLGAPLIPFGFRSLHAIPLNVDNPAELLRAIVRLTAKEPRPVPFPVRKANGLGWVEGLCLLALILAAAAFLLLMWR